MEIGLSTACFYPSITERALEEVIALGAGSVEFFLNAPSEFEPDYISGLRAALERAQVEVLSVHPFSSAFEPLLFFTEYERRFWDGMKWYDSYFEASAALGAKIFVLHGDRRCGSLPEEKCFERFASMSRRAREFGIILAHENVERSRSRESGFVRRMREYLGGEAHFVLDLKQAIRSGEDPFDMLEAMGDRLVHLHLSDSGPDADCLTPGRGTFDFRRLGRRLRELGYRGGGVIELYRQSYSGPEELKSGLRWLREIPEMNF